MPRYNDMINREPFISAHVQMSELVRYLKQEFQLEAVFDEVIYEQGIALSPAAQLMLIAPLVDGNLMQSYWQERGIQDTAVNIDTETLRQSLRQLIAEAKINPARADNFPESLTMEAGDGKEWSLRSAFSLIKSFASQFCNIPPFCGEKEQQ
jgi:hypothetical protein